MTLEKAYAKMLGEVDAKALGISRQSLYNARQNAKHGDYPKEQAMRKRLRAAGWKMQASESWGK